MTNFRFAVKLGLLIAALSAPSLSQNCTDQPGCLDTTFGSAGFVSATVNDGLYAGWAVDVAVQPDGKIVVAADSGNLENTGGDWYVLRFNSDGTPDGAFGNAGVSRFAFTSAFDNENSWALALQTDGKILVAGTTGGDVAGLARLNYDGSLDGSFGTGGKVTFQFEKRDSAIPRTIAVHSDGRIMVAGTSASSKFGFARFNPNGSLDKTFNGTGTFTAAVATKGNSGGLVEMAIQPDGKYVASGLNGAAKGKPQTWTLMRVNSNGGLDTSFGSGGMAITQFGGTWSCARNVAILPDGKILAGGDWLQSGTSGNQAYVFIRYHSNGQIDTTFGNDGKAIFNSPNFRRMEGMAVQADGKIVGSGWDRPPSSANSNVLIMRIDSDGVLDAGFGVAGLTLTDYLGRGDDGNAMAVQSDGKFVVAGIINAGTGSPGHIGLYRYLP